MILSETIASASADLAIEGRYSAAKSGGIKPCGEPPIEFNERRRGEELVRGRN